ncbi:MAG TPA: sigma 54-interacting transcriptional regulator [Blastocatellia bacterium]|nr:sigma 54-interacting transcriptional regulator [Blastocatellia bacterium]
MQTENDIQADINPSKLIELYEAREEILSRVHPSLSSVIDIDRFLQATVNEVGRRLGVDRCNIVMPTREGGFRVSYEYRADDQLRPGVGVNVPDYLIPKEKIREYLPQARPYAVDDITDSPIWIRTACQLIGTRSILIVPFVHNNELLGVMGLHYCYEPHKWTEFEVGLVAWLAEQITIGLIYTRLYADKEKEVEITKLLLEISNDINTRNDFSEIAAFVIDKALEVLRADYGCIGVLDTVGEHLHFDELRSRRGFDLRKSVEARFREARSIRLPDHPLVRRVMEDGSVLKLEYSRQSPLARYLLSNIIRGESALIAPIAVRNRIFGIVGLVWHNEATRFTDYETQLLTGISSQLAIALEKDRLAAEIIRLKRELNDARSGEKIIGSSPKIRQAIEMALSVADSQTTVLIQGESGTGKELIANLIQFNSGRAARPFIKINCGAIPQQLLETELFGHERGAFTDARSRRIGRFEEANGGTLFLDEIGEMSLAAQVSLLRVLQDGEFTRVGGNEVIKTDVRVIAATNKDLEAEIAEGRFRRDLYYRLNVYPIQLPPLRERPEDIYSLVAHFIDYYQRRSGKRVLGITDRALLILKGYSWPGNVRELENCIERAVIVAAGRNITEHDLPETIRAHAAIEQTGHLEISIPAQMEDIERAVIEQTLIYTNGDKAKAARLLGIGRKTLYRKLEQYKK